MCPSSTVRTQLEIGVNGFGGANFGRGVVSPRSPLFHAPFFAARWQRIVSDRRNPKDQNDTGHLGEGGTRTVRSKNVGNERFYAAVSRKTVCRGSKIRYKNQWTSQINLVSVFDVPKRMTTGAWCTDATCKSRTFLILKRLERQISDNTERY